MKKLLLVDDDALVLELYRKKLAASGFEVQTATDGLQAIKVLGAAVPDFMVLDLMMPRLSGVEVLKYMRSQPALAKVPVAVLTNAFMSEQARAVMSLGVEFAVIKGECTPARMLELVHKALSTGPQPAAPADSSAALTEARARFLQEGAASFTELRAVSQEFNQDPALALRTGNLADFYRQVHHLAGAAGAAQCHHLALLAGALEALLFELSDKPQFVNASTARTVLSSVEFLGVLLEDARHQRRPESVTGEVLVVDDDPVAARIALNGLTRAQLRVHTEENPQVALEVMGRRQFDLVLLDIEMPGMTGLDLCAKLRLLPGYEKTPVVFVTAHGEFENRARGILLGGNDLIAKPIFPIELAVKAVTHLIRGRLARVSAAVLA
jgi:CheY-like chemotaxis protein